MSFALALGDVISQLAQHGISIRVRLSPDQAPWSLSEGIIDDVCEAVARPLLDVTFVDYRHILYTSSNNKKHFQFVIRTLGAPMPRYNMEINWSKGKLKRWWATVGRTQHSGK